MNVGGCAVRFAGDKRKNKSDSAINKHWECVEQYVRVVGFCFVAGIFAPHSVGVISSPLLFYC